MDVVGRATQEAKAEDERAVVTLLALTPTLSRGEREKKLRLLVLWLRCRRLSLGTCTAGVTGTASTGAATVTGSARSAIGAGADSLRSGAGSSCQRWLELGRASLPRSTSAFCVSSCIPMEPVVGSGRGAPSCCGRALAPRPRRPRRLRRPLVAPSGRLVCSPLAAGGCGRSAATGAF